MEWKNEIFGVLPEWKIVPDREVVKRTITRALGIEASSNIQIDVSFLGEGAFNKVYEISVDGKAYALRVTLPVCPHWKTEAEAATMKFVKERTSAPVPTVLAYDSSIENELGYEWILMTFISGTPLHVDWRQRSMESKAKIVKSLAAALKDLLKPENRFRGIGSIFSISGHPGTYGLGHVISQVHWLRECAAPSKTYGPFPNTMAWFRNKTDTLIETQRCFLQNTENVGNGNDAAATIELIEEVQELLDNRLLDKPAFEATYLRHKDLHLGNILVGDNDQLAGIIDWEYCLAEPQWSATSAPKFLLRRVREVEPSRDEYGENYIPEAGEDYDESADWYYGDHEEKSNKYWEAMTEWEMTQLRKVYDAEMRRHVVDYDAIKEGAAEYLDYLRVMGELSNFWSWRYVWKWLECLWWGKEVGYQDVIDATLNATIDTDERFQIDRSQDEQADESWDGESENGEDESAEPQGQRQCTCTADEAREEGEHITPA